MSPIDHNVGLGSGDELNLTGNPLDKESNPFVIPGLVERGVLISNYSFPQAEWQNTNRVKSLQVRPWRGYIQVVADSPHTFLLVVTASLAGALTFHGYRNRRAEGVLLMRANDFDVALIDLGIPNISGDRVAITLKQYDPRISTILMTGLDLDEGDPRLSAFDFRVPKPIDLAQLNLPLAHAIDLSNSQTIRPTGG